MNGESATTRRATMAVSIAATAAPALPISAEAQRGAKVATRNVVLVHGRFADGSC